MQVARLDQFGFLGIRGKDAVTFLQGYTTCDLNHLSSDTSLLGAICNLQGRMVSSFRIVPLIDGVLLRLDRGLIESTTNFLAKYIVFSKAELVDMSDSYVCYGAIGDMQSPGPATIGEYILQAENIAIKVSESGPRYEIWSQGDVAGDITAEKVQRNTWQQAEIEDGYAWVNTQTTEEFIPQMFNYHNIGGIDFEKGCYLGQEIIARLEYRGKLKRKLHRGLSTNPAAPGDAVVNQEGKEIGLVASTAQHGDAYALLAVIQNAADNDIEVRVNEGEPFSLSPIKAESL
jgi:tRNA-modifying protein YgfZ